jgi:murein DD-endopeptidase MepM/ murein hydrolase activator NlpD
MKYYNYKGILLLVFCLVLAVWGRAQYDPQDEPRPLQPEKPLKEEITKYRWPLNINNGFSSSFQEFRSNHFHVGCDLRTFQKTGYPVYAIADGVIYKIRMVKRGSGRGLYLKHDDGNTSIYFHLQRFENNLEALLKRVQHLKKKKYFGNYFLKKPLRYRKGQIIAYSGETGSGFPHLHLEIRDRHYFALNPFKRLEFPGEDKQFPVIKGLLLRSRGSHPINGKIGETFIKFQKKEKDYFVATTPLVTSGSFDPVLNAYDISDTGKHVAPYTISVFIDNTPYFQLRFERVERDDNNQLGFVYDMYYSNSGSYFFNLFTQEGFLLEDKKIPFRQVIENLDLGKHQMRIQVTDNNRNVSTAVVPLYKIQPPVLEISRIQKNSPSGETQLLLDIEKLTAEPPPAGEIKIQVFDNSRRKISSASLHYHSITAKKSLVIKGFSPQATSLEFDFYAHHTPYFKKQYSLADHPLANITDIDFDTFLNRDEVYILVTDSHLSGQDITLTVIQGQQSQVLKPQNSSEGCYFQFTPLNRENRVLLRFSIMNGQEKRAEIQKIIHLAYLEPGSKQVFKYEEFEASFDTRAVYEPKALLMTEKNYSSQYPVLSRQISLSPFSFPYLDTVIYKFKKKLPNPKQVGIFQYNPLSKKWSSVYTSYDSSTGTYQRRLISSGIFALMRDIFPPHIRFISPGTKYKKNLRRLVVKISDKGKGVNDNLIKVWLNGRRICTSYDCACDYDPDWRSFTIGELGQLRTGKNLLKVQVKDYAGNSTSRSYTFYLK